MYSISNDPNPDHRACPISYIESGTRCDSRYQPPDKLSVPRQLHIHADSHVVFNRLVCNIERMHSYESFLNQASEERGVIMRERLLDYDHVILAT